MFETLNRITLSGVELPIKCDLIVLEKIQDRYESITDFENLIYKFTPQLDEKGNPVIQDGAMIGTVATPPNLRALGDGLVWMVQEGLAIARDEGEDFPTYSAEQLKRMVDMPPYALSELVHGEFLAAFERKNSTTPQTRAGETETTT